MSSVCNALPAQRDYEPCAYQTHTGTLSVEAARASLRRGHPAGRYQARRREPNRPTLFHLARRHGHRRGERHQAPRPGRRGLRRPAGPRRPPAAPQRPDHSASDPLARARDRSKAPGRARRLRSRGGRRLAPAVPVTLAGAMLPAARNRRVKPLLVRTKKIFLYVPNGLWRVWPARCHYPDAHPKAAATGARRSTSSGPVRSGRDTKTVFTPRSASSR
jgi:hypothetical protein